MKQIPKKCETCNHTIMEIEKVHIGWCRYQYEVVVRCDCAPQHYIVGCCCAEQYCRNKRTNE